MPPAAPPPPLKAEISISSPSLELLFVFARLRQSRDAARPAVRVREWDDDTRKRRRNLAGAAEVRGVTHAQRGGR